MAAKIEAGTYQCKTTAATIYEAPSGAVMCRIALDIGLTGGICLIQKDGTLSERGFRDVQAILGIEGAWDWAAWERDPAEWAGHDIEAVVEITQGDRGEFSSVKYLNVPGGSANMPKADAKTLATKYGAKTRALFGGAPAKPAAPKPAPNAPPKSGKTSTMEACWDEWCKKNDGNDTDAWYAAVKKMAGKEQNDCQPENWGRMMAHLTDQIPY